MIEIKEILDISKMPKIIKDCIYGQVHIPPLCLKFIDTPAFQRLRYVKQLGSAYLSYPSATHSRFEHSIGVMYLAGKAVDQLRNYMSIDDRIKHLIQLAGLYHDCGHMVFSHLFDVFLKMNPPSNEVPDIFKHHEHEDRSIYFIRSVNKELQLLTAEEEQFVANAIRGIIPQGEPPYLYQIVCNKECGVDVDKMDYLYRDSYHVGFPCFQSDYILSNMRLDETNSIAFNRKARRSIKDLFITRKRLFKDLYQHHTALKIDKIRYCCMKYLGPELYQYGENTNDYNIETLIASKEELKPLLEAVAYRKLDHDCPRCSEYVLVKSVKQSGTIKNVRFI